MIPIVWIHGYPHSPKIFEPQLEISEALLDLLPSQLRLVQVAHHAHQPRTPRGSVEPI